MEEFVKQIDELSELQSKALLVEIRQALREHAKTGVVDEERPHKFWGDLFDMYENVLEKKNV